MLSIIPSFGVGLSLLTLSIKMTSSDVAAFLAAAGGGPSSIPVMSTAATFPVYTIASVGKAENAVTRAIRCTVEVRGGQSPFRVRRWEDQVPIYEEEEEE